MHQIDVPPAAPPRNTTLGDVAVVRPGSFRIRIDTTKLGEVAALLGIEDAEIPASWDGATVEVHALHFLVVSFAAWAMLGLPWQPGAGATPKNTLRLSTADI